MRRLLPVVDYQKDFVDGTLGFPDTEALDGPITAKIAACRAAGGDVALILGTHGPDHLDTREGWKLLVPHCLPNSESQRFYSQTGQTTERSRDMVIDKDAFPSLWLTNWLKEQDYGRVELAGLVSYLYIPLSTIMIKVTLPEAEIVVDISYTIGPDPDLHAKGLDMMEVLQIAVLNR